MIESEQEFNASGAAGEGKICSYAAINIRAATVTNKRDRNQQKKQLRQNVTE